jgi:TonB-linked SusC/RagA family outer membrane protein
MKIFRLTIILLLSFIALSAVNAQEILTGVVKDETFNEPLIGVNVYVVNSGNRTIGGTVTGVDGDYKLQVPEGKDLTLVFSLVGYKSVRVKYANQKVVNTVLKDETYTLDDVMITAKAVTKNQVGLTQRELVSATQKITMEMLETAPVVSIEDALQGRLANVDILSGAEPGSSSSIRIRGTSSLNASNEPLIVIDGIPYNTTIKDDFEFATADAEDFGALLNISPTDIEAIEVLKDAAATAIWGSKGANGVLLITTKKGRSGKTQFSFSSKFQFGKEPNTIPMLNASQYVALMQDAIWNTVNDRGYKNSQDYLALLYNTPEIGYDPAYGYFKEYSRDTDWLDEITQTGISASTDFSMTGGGEKANYRLALGYLNEEGTTIGTGFERISSLLSVRYKFSNKLDITTDFAFTNSNREDNWDNPRGHALTKMPNMSPYYLDEYGNRTGEYFTPQGGNFQGNIDTGKLDDSELKGVFNPVAVVNESQNKTSSTESRFTFSLHYQVLPGLDYWGIASLNVRKNKNKRFLPQSVTGLPWTNSWFNRSADAISDNIYINTDNKLIYTKYFEEKHKIVLTSALQTTDAVNSNYTSEVSGNASTATADPTAGGNITKMGSGVSQNRQMGTIFNAYYSFKERYMINAAYRYEANSSMGANNRWAGFPTFGVGWIASEESFFRNLKWLSTLKFRYSWGESGNAPTGSYSYIGTFKAINPGYIDMNAIEPNQIQLDNLKWETVSTNNIGIDFYLLDERLRFTVDLYDKKSEDLLQKDVGLPSSSGYSEIKWYNSGQMRNRGWEFRVDYDFLKIKDWFASVNFNISQNENEILEMPDNLTEYKYSFGNGEYAYKVKIGDPLGSFYGYKYLGVYGNEAETYAKDKNGNLILDIDGNPVYMKNGSRRVYPGDAKYSDMNGDGVIDQYDICYLGNSMPRFNGGGGLNLKFKNLSLNMFFHGRAGQKAVNQTRIDTENMRGKSNQSVAVLRRWRHEGDDTDIPRALYDQGYNYLGSDRFVEDASFLRLKTVTLRFAVPRSVLTRWGVNKLDIWATGYDLYTWTKYTGQDPEVALSKDDGLAYLIAKDKSYTPKARKFAFGFTLGF